jgi:predicted nuclease of predicted toxin-antitoxin system
MKLLVDMNLSPDWVKILTENGLESLHWLIVGKASASDHEIAAWAETNGYVLFTHDLDFGAILAATKAKGPSVVQIRAQDVNPHHIGNSVTRVLRQFRQSLEDGALLTIDETKSRVRILPLTK